MQIIHDAVSDRAQHYLDEPQWGSSDSCETVRLDNADQQFSDSSQRLLAEALAALERVVAKIADEQRFRECARKWKCETRFVSNITARSTHRSYQQIVGMGWAAVPLILKDLVDNGPDDWFWALSVITDENPITDDIAGDMDAMTEAWLKWGLKEGYLKGYYQKTKENSPTSNE